MLRRRPGRPGRGHGRPGRGHGRPGGGHGRPGGGHGRPGGGHGRPPPIDISCPRRKSLPSARLVSHEFHTGKDVPSTLVTHMVTQFGQFLDHDITFTPENEDHDCCSRRSSSIDECFPIRMSPNDPFYSLHSVKCLEFTRSTAFCEENGGARQQMNGITSFIDASNVYGSDEDTGDLLRSFEDGKLEEGSNRLLPKSIGSGNFFAGDTRAREMPGLASMHTLFMREHNRICDLIKSVRGHWKDEQIYQNARRILIAEYQNIVYAEYLPLVLGSENMDGLQLRYISYNQYHASSQLIDFHLVLMDQNTIVKSTLALVMNLLQQHLDSDIQ